MKVKYVLEFRFKEDVMDNVAEKLWRYIKSRNIPGLVESFKYSRMARIYVDVHDLNVEKLLDEVLAVLDTKPTCIIVKRITEETLISRLVLD